MDFSKERKLIHAMSNHLTIIHGAVKKALKELEKENVLPQERERLAKADENLKLCNSSLKELREVVLTKINAEESHS
jgi:hypothetical protein